MRMTAPSDLEFEREGGAPEDAPTLLNPVVRGVLRRRRRKPPLRLLAHSCSCIWSSIPVMSSGRFPVPLLLLVVAAG